MGVNKKITAKKLSTAICAVLMIFGMTFGMGASTVYAANPPDATVSTDIKKLQNGSFEGGPSFDGNYAQPDQSLVPYWSTTAFQGKIELFKTNTGTYINNVTLSPTHGTYAAELNADEESTLYQTVSTTASSIYEWGLDHGGRTTRDTMALVIGPKQPVNPSKPDKNGRDQFMQMLDWLKVWLKDNKNTELKNIKVEDSITVYSKKFAANGTFADNAGDNAFSLTPSTIYTEEWHIWIMNDGRASSGENPWGHYGANAEGSAGTSNGSGSTTVDLTKYYLYTVPAGQTDTLFAFVSVECEENKGKTFGNFLDNINFQLYHSLSGSTSNHGSAVIGGSDGNAEGEGASEGHKVTIDDKLATYVTHGEPLKIQAVIKKVDAEDGCEFVGVYHTEQDENGNAITTFVQLAGNNSWTKSINSDGDIIYTYYLSGLTSATDLHFIFIKSPTLTYDPNGGKDYVVERTYNKDEAANVYSFKPYKNTNPTQTGTGTIFIDPYVSHAAEGQNDGWKFMGWKLTGDIVDSSGNDLVNKDQLNSLILPAKHVVACDYHYDGVNKDGKAQIFKIYLIDENSKDEPLSGIIQTVNNAVTGVTWGSPASAQRLTYLNVHKGITMVAQWRWQQAFIPQVGSGSSYTDSDIGGTVEIISVDMNDKDQSENYNAAYNTTGGKSYHAKTDEKITVKATAKDYCTFEGWYDASGKLITTNAEYTYTETKESVNTYYARFSNSVTQTYIRQVKNGDTWVDTEDDNIGTLGRYTYTDAAGNQISSTATAGTGYKFVGWYDAAGKKVDDSMLINDKKTLSYTTTGDATYYARFEKAYTVNFAAQTKQANGSFSTNTAGGKVSVASVTDVAGATAKSKATANAGYKFLGWYDKNGNQLSTNSEYKPTITADTNGVTYYARFEIITTVSAPYLSFVAESADTQIPDAFNGRNAGTDKNVTEYGLADGFGNTISTGFKYSVNNMTNVKTIQITVKVPADAYVKVGGTADSKKFTGNGIAILTDSNAVRYNKGSIQQISGETTLIYYWDAAGLQANTTYGFIIDNLYAPGATATITVNGTEGTQVTSTNGVVNKPHTEYKANSKYKKK